ncbi:hypothetical protein ZWY2020_055739, partial [Hordeum vulgare]
FLQARWKASLHTGGVPQIKNEMMMIDQRKDDSFIALQGAHGGCALISLQYTVRGSCYC